MPTRGFYFGERDQAASSWVIFESDGKKPKRTSALPPNALRLFGPYLDPNRRMKAEYLSLTCLECGRYDEDDIFETGFSDPVTIKIKGDFGHTQDRVFIISSKMLDVLVAGKVRGFEQKPVGTSGWHALRITCRVECAESVLAPSERRCNTCSRPAGSVGSFKRESDINIPDDDNTFFTTRINWHRRLWDRDIFVTENVVGLLKKSGIKGGYCNALLTAQEDAEVQRRSTATKRWEPPGLSVIL